VRGPRVSTPGPLRCPCWPGVLGGSQRTACGKGVWRSSFIPSSLEEELALIGALPESSTPATGASCSNFRFAACIMALTPFLRPTLGTAMSNISNELIWGIVRDTSCHVLRRKQSGTSGMGKRGAEFTLEPSNLTGFNSWKYSGLANSKTIELTSAGDSGVVLTTKSTDSASAGKPTKAFKKVTYNTRDFRRVAKAIKKETADKFYRSDLQKAALAKWSLIYASQKRKKKAA